MTEATTPQQDVYWDIADVTDHGERVTHLFPNDCYYAHLAIYRFALQFCQQADVLDTGCGAGYGAAYLAERGARTVVGIDISAKAIGVSRHFFTRGNLQFREMGLGKMTGFAPGSFDFIYCSNVLEHVEDVPAFLHSAVELLRPQGRALFVVPPITSPELRAADLLNVYHLNSWSPKQWHHVFSQYFQTIQPYGDYFNKPGYHLNFSNLPDATGIDESDFLFKAIPLEAFNLGNSLGAMFLAQSPRPIQERPDANTPVTFVDDSFSRPPPDFGPASSPIRTTTGAASRLAAPAPEAAEEEFFLPVLGLDLKPYLDREDLQGIHHLGRYHWATQVLRTLRPGTVLDIACGAGYGAYILAEGLPGAQITGADYDPRAIAVAQATYQRENLRYCQGDLVSWISSAPEASVPLGEYNVIVSFDTLEHIAHRDVALMRIVANLASDGAMLFSTPSGGAVTALQPEWWAHKIEYNAADLKNLLGRFFREVLVPEDGTLPGIEFWNDVINCDKPRYLNVANPIVCRFPIR